jgi:hypothetical protein
MEKTVNRGKTQMPMTILILLQSIVLLLWHFHIISNGWTVGIFFLVLIPFATLKAFSDFRKQ